MDIPSNILSELDDLSKPGRGFKPHKYILLLAVLRLVREGKITDRRVYFNESLRQEFRHILGELGDQEDRDRPYAPYFHLSNTSFWRLVSPPGCEGELEKVKTVGGPGILSQLVKYAEISESFFQLIKNDNSRTAIENKIRSCIILGRETRSALRVSVGSEQISSLQRITGTDTDRRVQNPFVSYLNSLQRLNASNDGALAEYQARNPNFVHIHVSHPVTQAILAELKMPAGRHVILTGHAGDGKSTVALEVYKHLSGMPMEKHLTKPLETREDIRRTNITILKDLSERKRGDDAALVRELQNKERRFLLVTNTGTILDLLRAHASSFKLSEIKIESDVLNALGAEGGEAELVLDSTRFLVVNLARLDNLEIARTIFARMIAPERWISCYEHSCRSSCPILKNVDLINSRKDTIFDRIFLAYRRMYEYGTRLTLRQITEHLSYLVTSGLEESDIAELRNRRPMPLMAEFMFFNRFFGDNGMADQPAALAMQAVKDIRIQGYGERTCPVWERKLWLKLRNRYFSLGVEECDEEFDLLREHGSGPGDNNRPGLSPDQAREQVRRMLYFLYEFPSDDQSYLIQYLNSLTILRWREWQKTDAHLDMTEKNAMEHRIYHVLQEHFTGIRLPERATGHDRRLYITLSRGRNEIRQSAQVVLAQIDWSNETVLDLVQRSNSFGGTRTDLVLQGRGRIKGANLVLTLPFLDYVVMRHFGEVGEILEAAYVERLERFKTQVQRLANENRNDVLLVRLKTDHTFRRQQYVVRDNMLEVNDVL